MKIQHYRKFNLFLSIFIVFLLTNSCAKYCALYHPCLQGDSTVMTERVVYKDSIIRLPGDTLMFTDILPCPDYDTTVNSAKQTIKVIIKDRILTAAGICKEDSLKARISWLEKSKETVKTVTFENKVTPVWNFILFGALSIIVLFLLIKLITK